MGEGTSDARAEVLAAREVLDRELVRLEASARAAVDIKAKIRRSPAKAAGVAAAAGFVVVGGPKRLFRRAKRAVLGPQEPLPASMLPKEVDASLRKLGSDGDRVRGLLEREFANYLDETAPRRKGRDVSGALVALVLLAGRAVATRYGKQIVDEVLSGDPTAYREQVQRALERQRHGDAGSGTDRPA